MKYTAINGVLAGMNMTLSNIFALLSVEKLSLGHSSPFYFVSIFMHMVDIRYYKV